MPPSQTRTTPRQFRLGEASMAKLDALAEKLGGISRTDVLRQAIEALYSQHLPTTVQPPKKSRKKSADSI